MPFSAISDDSTCKINSALLTLKKSRQPVQRSEFLLCKLKLRDTYTARHMYNYFPFIIYFTQTWPPLLLMFSHFISHSPTVTHKGYKVLMGGPSCTLRRQCTPLWQSPAFHGDVTEPSTQSKAQLSSNPDESNRNIKKTELSLFRGLEVCYLSLQVCVISPRYMVTVPVLRESYLLGSQ